MRGMSFNLSKEHREHVALSPARWPYALDPTAGARVPAPATRTATGGTVLSSLNRGQRVIDTTAALVEFGEITAMELAEYLGVTRYDAHAVLNRMNKRTRAKLRSHNRATASPDSALRLFCRAGSRLLC